MSREANGCSDLTSAIPYSWRLSKLTPLFIRKRYHTGVKQLLKNKANVPHREDILAG